MFSGCHSLGTPLFLSLQPLSLLTSFIHFHDIPLAEYLESHEWQLCEHYLLNRDNWNLCISEPYKERAAGTCKLDAVLPWGYVLSMVWPPYLASASSRQNKYMEDSVLEENHITWK